MGEQQQILTRFLMAPSQQYDASHKRRIDHHFSDDIHFKPAAVLIPLVPREQGFNVVLTRRAEHLKHHPGQIAFPGGRFETSDNDLITTALRETYEETGIVCQRNNVIGQLTPLATTSGYIVTPLSQPLAVTIVLNLILARLMLSLKCHSITYLILKILNLISSTFEVNSTVFMQYLIIIIPYGAQQHR